MRFLLAAALLFAQPAQTAPPRDFTLAVDVSLSPAAAARLASGEGLVVNASFEGEPAPAFRNSTPGDPHVTLLAKKLTLPGRPDTASIHASTAQMPLRKIEGPILLNINVYSARRTSPDNLLNCDIFDGPLTDALALHPIPLHCTLITEQQPNRALK